MSSDRDHSMMSFLLGAAVGGIAALLFAPRSGQETRRQLSETAGSLQDRGVAAVRSVADDARSLTSETTTKVREKAGEVSELVRDTVHDAASSARGQVDAVKEATSEAKRAYQKEMHRRD
jgi:gas vesicle protein